MTPPAGRAGSGERPRRAGAGAGARRRAPRRARRSWPGPQAVRPPRRPRRARRRARTGSRSPPTRPPRRASRRRPSGRRAPTSSERSATGSPARHSQNASSARAQGSPRVVASSYAAARRGDRPGQVALEPGVLGPGRGRRPEPLQLLGRHRVLPGPSSVAPASASPRRACSRPITISAEHLLTPNCSPMPIDARASASAARHSPRSRRRMARTPSMYLHVALELALLREAQRAVDVVVDTRVAAQADERSGREVHERPRGVIVVAGAGGERRTPPPAARARARSRVRRSARCRRSSGRGRRSRCRRAAGPARPRASRARSPRRARSLSIASCERPLSASASSRLSGNASSTTIARSPAAAASLPSPVHHSRRESQRRSSPARQIVASGLVDRQQCAAGLQRAFGTPAQVRLQSDAFERLGVVAVRGRERRLPVLERLPVAAGRAGRPGGDGSEPADRVGVARAPRVVHEPRRIGAAGGLQGPQHDRGELALADRRDRVLDRAAREVVPEGERLAAQGQQPGHDALVDRGGVRADQRQLDAAAGRRRRVRGPPAPPGPARPRAAPRRRARSPGPLRRPARRAPR